MKYEKYSVFDTIKYYTAPFLRMLWDMLVKSVMFLGLLFVILFILNYVW